MLKVIIKDYVSKKDNKQKSSLYLVDTETGDKYPINLYCSTPKEFGYKFNRIKEILKKEDK